MATMFLGTVIGWYLVIISIFLLLRREKVTSIMEDVIAHRGLLFFMAVLTIILGLLMVVSHNIWVNGWPIVITLFSWFVLITGLLRLWVPELTLKVAQSFISHPRKIVLTAVILLTLGLYLLVNVYHTVNSGWSIAIWSF